MRKVLLFAVAVLLAGSMILPAVASAEMSLSQRLQGYFLLSVEQNGEIWFVLPGNGQRVPVHNSSQAWSLISGSMIGISNADLYKLPEPYTSAIYQDEATQNRLRGRFLLAVEAHGEVWFVNPHDGFRYYLGTGAETYTRLQAIALGITLRDLNAIPVVGSQPVVLTQPVAEQPVVVEEPVVVEQPVEQPVIISEPEVVGDQFARLDMNQIKASLGGVEYTDAVLGWEFASSLWSAYEQYHRDHQDYPATKWLEGIFYWNQAVYFDETGYTLSPHSVIYWSWDNLSMEFFKMYFEHFSMTQDSGGNALMTIYLPGTVETPQFGTLEAGTYYFSSEYGFMNQEQYDAKANEKYNFDLDGVDLDAETERVIGAVRTIQAGLAGMYNEIHGYPTLQNTAIELGREGTKVLTRNGFEETATDGIVYLSAIPNGGTTTQIMYDSYLGGRSYIITFSLYGTFSKYGKIYAPGQYEAVPNSINYLGPLPESN